MPSLLPSVLRNVGRVVSNRAKTGEEVMHIFKSLNNLTNSGDHDSVGIGLR